MASELRGFRMVSAEVLHFPDEYRIVFFVQGPVNEVGELHTTSEQEFVFRRNGSVVVSDWVSMERAGMNCATVAVSSKKFREGGMEIVGDEGGNNVFLAIRDNKEMASANGIEVVLPSRTWLNFWLGTIGAQSTPLRVSVHSLGR